MTEKTFADHFAADWVSAWNTHDLPAIMDHYAENVVFQSPLIVQINNDPSGTISDKKALSDYFSRALNLYPDLHFELYTVLVSVNSVVLYYKSVKEMKAAEFMQLDENGKVVNVCAHYAQ
jgi:ketosteroid isomerase-like protein